MVREDLEDLHAFFFTLLFDFVAKDDLGAGLMHASFEFDPATFFGLFDRPSREHARDFRDISLRVAAVDAQGVQLHQLATVVFIQSAPLFVFGLARRTLIGEVIWKASAIITWPPGHTLDRKSTRLNSSHVAISYAVFC